MIPQGGLKYRLRTRSDSNHNFVLGAVGNLEGSYGETVLQDMRIADLDHTVWVAVEASPPSPRMFHLRLTTSSTIFLSWADSGQLFMLSLGNAPDSLSRDSSLFYFQDSDPVAWMNDPNKQTPSGDGWQKIRRIWTGHWDDAHPDDGLAQALDLAGGNLTHGAAVIAFRNVGGAPNQDWWVEYIGAT
jgi:hypothetical protein